MRNAAVNFSIGQAYLRSADAESKANNKFSKQQSLIKVYKIQGFTLNAVNPKKERIFLIKIPNSKFMLGASLRIGKVMDMLFKKNTLKACFK